jgi:hypothetical protein
MKNLLSEAMNKTTQSSAPTTVEQPKSVTPNIYKSPARKKRGRQISEPVRTLTEKKVVKDVIGLDELDFAFKISPIVGANLIEKVAADVTHD